jgi:transporter family protein
MFEALFPGWAIPILLSAFGLGFYDVCKKDAVRDNSVMPVLFFATLSGSLFFVLLTLCRGNLSEAASCSGVTWWRLLGKSALVGSSWICVYYAMRDLPISIAAPVRASSPLWTLIGGILLFGEIPGVIQAAGMCLIFVGYYFFAVFGKTEGFTLKHHGVYLILLGTLLGACSALYDRYLLGTLGIF